MTKISDSVARMQSVSKLIKKNYLKIDAPKLHVVMLAELWNLYYDEGKIHLCQNILNYAAIENALKKVPEAKEPVLLVSLMDSKNECFPYAYFKNGEIELINKKNQI